MSYDPYATDLPIGEILRDVTASLDKQPTLIVHAPPGAGKSTILPLALLDCPFLDGKKIVMLEPRRLAARAVAMRMSELLGEEVGKTVGYRIRFETRVSEDTVIEVVTEGILTKMLQSDNSLEGVGMIIFDEFHERSIHADVALALTRESQQVLRPDLRVIIMSATLDIPGLQQLLNAPVVESDGRQFPVDIKYAGDSDERLLADLTARVIQQATRENEGDVLAFFPGQGEITACESILRRTLKGFAIQPLYGQLPFAKQKAAIMKNKGGKRRVVLATSIAETSLTIEGVDIVVDTGFGRTQVWDPRSGLSRLQTVGISRDSATQRAGRAGRLSPGVCYRMWSKATEQRMLEHRVPEILEADLSFLVLELAKWGLTDPKQLSWLTAPPRGTWLAAREVLHELGALEDGRITEHGLRMHELPCHPRLAHMLLLADDEDQVPLAADIAALLEEKDPLGREAGIDLNLRVEALRTHRREERRGGRLDRIEKVSASYRNLFEVEPENDSPDPYETGLLITYAYPERIASARPGNNAQFKLSNGRIAMAGHKDDLAHESWLAVANLDARDGMGKIFLAAPLNPTDLASRVTQDEVVEWDTEDGGLRASLDTRIGNIVLKSEPLPDPDPAHLEAAIIRAVKKEGARLLNWSDQVKNWQARVLSLRKWRPSDNWPEATQDALLYDSSEWLAPYLKGVKTPQDLNRLNLLEILHYSLPQELQRRLNELAPEELRVPSGSNIKLAYRADGEPPILAARIQELFGMADTPTVNEGGTKVLIHLLSPGFKPVQVTTDMESFWKDTYFEVRKDLKRRYPKHYWPDDPLSAEAVKGVKKK